MNDARLKLEDISAALMDIIDRLEELGEDEETLSKPINAVIDELTKACDMLENI